MGIISSPSEHYCTLLYEPYLVSSPSPSPGPSPTVLSRLTGHMLLDSRPLPTAYPARPDRSQRHGTCIISQDVKTFYCAPTPTHTHTLRRTEYLEGSKRNEARRGEAR